MRRWIWTEAEKARVLDLRGQGLPSSEIASQLGRTRNAVCGVLERMVQEGREIPVTAYRSVKPRRARARVVERKPKRPSLPMWEMDADDRRLVSWQRARQAAHEALQVVARVSPTINTFPAIPK